MLDMAPAPAEGDGMTALAAEVGTALEGLRLPDGTLIFKLERDGVVMQVRIAEGTAFDPVGGSVAVTLTHARTWPGRYARAGDFWRLAAGSGDRDREYLIALDGTLAERSAYAIAVDIYGEKKVARDWYPDSPMRSRVRYRIERSVYLMTKSYLELAAGH